MAFRDDDGLGLWGVDDAGGLGRGAWRGRRGGWREGPGLGVEDLFCAALGDPEVTDLEPNSLQELMTYVKQGQLLNSLRPWFSYEKQGLPAGVVTNETAAA